MTTGHKISGTYGQGARYHVRAWSGRDDPAHKAWNPYTTRVHWYDRSLTTGRHNITGATTFSGYVYNPVDIMPAELSSNLELKLISKLVDDIRGHDFNAAVAAAEFGQTKGLILNTLSGLRGIVQGTRARNIAMVTRAFAAMTSGKKLTTIAKSTVKAGDISGTVLATYYGWIPLFQDIYEAMRAYETRTAGPRSIRYGVGITGPKEFRTIVNPGIYGASNPANKVFWRGHRSVRLEVEFLEELSLARSLGLYNPASVLWEKLPWSFVFDWFIPIGSYLDALGVIPFLSLRYMRSDFARATYSSWSGHPWIEGGYTYTGGSIKGEIMALDRTIGTKLNVPLPTLKTVEQALSLPHLRNAAALIHQAIANGKRGTS